MFNKFVTILVWQRIILFQKPNSAIKKFILEGHKNSMNYRNKSEFLWLYYLSAYVTDLYNTHKWIG